MNEHWIIDLGSVYRIKYRHINLHENTDVKVPFAMCLVRALTVFILRFSFFIVD